MTDAEKKMKKYTASVEQRLNLPAKIKTRVMSDFISAVTARRESGLTDEEIYRELGSPAQAAATLNEQMKEYTYRKSPWRFVFLAAAFYGLWELLGNTVAWSIYLFMKDPMLLTGDSASIGIIGGADGPTAIFVTAPDWLYWIVPVFLLTVGIYGFLRLRKCKPK